jgi:putative FmdB family regulatory protein
VVACGHPPATPDEESFWKETGTMPLFEFMCARCGTTFEQLVRTTSTQQVVCPKCHGVHVQKQMSSFAVRGASSSGSGGAGTPAAACAPGGG